MDRKQYKRRLTILVVAFTRMAESFEQGRNVAFDHLLVAKKRCRTFGKRSGQELCRFSINWWRLVLQGLQAVFLNRFDAKTRVKGIYSFNQSRNDVGLLLLELLQDDRERLRGAVLELQKMISFNCQCIASQWDVKPYNLFCLGIPSFFIIKMGQPLPHFCYFCLIHNLMTNTASIKPWKESNLDVMHSWGSKPRPRVLTRPPKNLYECTISALGTELVKSFYVYLNWCLTPARSPFASPARHCAASATSTTLASLATNFLRTLMRSL